jgi:hypothetical protein
MGKVEKKEIVSVSYTESSKTCIVGFMEVGYEDYR